MNHLLVGITRQHYIEDACLMEKQLKILKAMKLGRRAPQQKTEDLGMNQSVHRLEDEEDFGPVHGE